MFDQVDYESSWVAEVTVKYLILWGLMLKGDSSCAACLSIN